MGPQDFMSRDADGFMDKITDLMDDDVLVAPGKTPRLKVPVKYVGANAEKHDNIAGTGLTWKQGETRAVDTEAAEKLLRYPDVWQFDPDAMETYTVAADGSAVLEYRATADEVTAILEGRAELRVVAIAELNAAQIPAPEGLEAIATDQVKLPAETGQSTQTESTGSGEGQGNGGGTTVDPVAEQVAAMTKAELIAFASEKFDQKLSARTSVDDLRLQVFELIKKGSAQ